MVSKAIARDTSPAATTERRVAVLESALVTFGRFGYRKTSMEEVAKAARISRPGLYFLFASKEDLFRAAVSHALQEDLAEVERLLGILGRPVQERLLDAFDRWAGRYIGPMAKDLPAVIEDNPELLGNIVVLAPRRFSALIMNAVASGVPKHDRKIAGAVAQTLISTSIGIKYQVGTRAEYRERLRTAIDLLVR